MLENAENVTMLMQANGRFINIQTKTNNKLNVSWKYQLLLIDFFVISDWWHELFLQGETCTDIILESINASFFANTIKYIVVQIKFASGSGKDEWFWSQKMQKYLLIRWFDASIQDEVLKELKDLWYCLRYSRWWLSCGSSPNYSEKSIPVYLV